MDEKIAKMILAKRPIDLEPQNRTDLSIQHAFEILLNFFMHAWPLLALVAALVFLQQRQGFVVRQDLQSVGH
jgi:hypothetical protein